MFINGAEQCTISGQTQVCKKRLHFFVTKFNFFFAPFLIWWQKYKLSQLRLLSPFLGITAGRGVQDSGGDKLVLAVVTETSSFRRPSSLQMAAASNFRPPLPSQLLPHRSSDFSRAPG